MNGNKKQKIAADQLAAQAGHLTMTTQLTSGHSDYGSMFAFRNGKGDVLQTPKRSSVARAQALLAPSSPCHLTITGSDWPVAAVVSRQP